MDGNVQAMDREISEIAKSAETRNTRRIVIVNEMGATGVDYQGDFTNIIFDPHLTSNADLAQAIKRTGRPNPKSSSDNTGKTRWGTSRYIVYSEAKIQFQLNEFLLNENLVNYAEKLWSGSAAKDISGAAYMKIGRAHV